MVASLLILFSMVSLVTSYSITVPQRPPTSVSLMNRREWMLVTSATTASAVSRSTAASAETGFSTFNDPVHGFSIKVPGSWQQTTQTLPDRRTILFWADPSDPTTLMFIAYTPVRDDFTSLSSFGSVDQVAAQTILPKGQLAGEESIQSKMLSAESKKQAYFFDYVQTVPPQPETHFRTIFTLVQGATGGAGAVLVTITAQAPQERYGALEGTVNQIIDSYGKSIAT